MQTSNYLEDLTDQLKEAYQKIILDKFEFKIGDTIQITYTLNPKYGPQTPHPPVIVKIENIICSHMTTNYCCIEIHGKQRFPITKNPAYTLRIEKVDKTKYINFYSDYEILKVDEL